MVKALSGNSRVICVKKSVRNSYDKRRGRKAKSADVESEILDEIEKGNYHTRQQIADMIKDKFNITVTVTAVSRLLKKTDSKN